MDLPESLRKIVVTGSLCLWIALALARVAQAQSGGRSMFGQMQGHLDPITASMGGYAPVWGLTGLGSAMTNPALLEESGPHAWFVGWSSRPAGLQQGGFAMRLPLKGISNWHAAVGTQFTGTGSMAATDPYGSEIGQTQAGEAVIQASLGQRFSPKLNWGVQTRLVSSYLGSYSAWGAGLSMAFRYTDTAQKLGLCLLLQDANIILKDYVNTSASSRFPPIRMSLILSNELKHLPLRWSLGMQHLQNWNLRYNDPNDPYKTDNLLLGEDSVTSSNPWSERVQEAFLHLVFNAELRLGKAIRLRGGYNALQRAEWAFPERSGSSGFSFGIGLVGRRFRMDYGTHAQTLAGRQNSVAFAWNFH